MHLKVCLFSAQNTAIRELTPPLNVQSDSFKQNYLNDTALIWLRSMLILNNLIFWLLSSQNISRTKRADVYLNAFELENGVTMSLKRRSLLSLIFTFSCFTKPLLIKTYWAIHWRVIYPMDSTIQWIDHYHLDMYILPKLIIWDKQWIWYLHRELRSQQCHSMRSCNWHDQWTFMRDGTRVPGENTFNSGWSQLKLSPHTVTIVEVEAWLINAISACLPRWSPNWGSYQPCYIIMGPHHKVVESLAKINI